MNTIVELTRFVNDVQVDLNYLNLQRYKAPLIIATREGQLGRIRNWNFTNGPLKLTYLGWWNLWEYGYIDLQGLTDKWKKFDAVIFLDPERCAEPTMYAALITTVSNL